MAVNPAGTYKVYGRDSFKFVRYLAKHHHIPYTQIGTQAKEFYVDVQSYTEYDIFLECIEYVRGKNQRVFYRKI